MAKKKAVKKKSVVKKATQTPLASKTTQKKKCSWTLCFATIALTLVFVNSLIGKLMNFSGTAGWIGSKYPMPEFLLVCAIIMLVVGIISMLTGHKIIEVGIPVLIVYTVLATLMFHIGEGQMGAFLKNLAIIGGLVALREVGCKK